MLVRHDNDITINLKDFMAYNSVFFKPFLHVKIAP